MHKPCQYIERPRIMWIVILFLGFILGRSFQPELASTRSKDRVVSAHLLPVSAQETLLRELEDSIKELKGLQRTMKEQVDGLTRENQAPLLAERPAAPIVEPGRRCELSAEERSWLELSYPFPSFYPMPDFKFVMETKPGTCDLFGGPAVCEAVSKGRHFEPEYHVREALFSFMIPCLFKKCYGVDIGASEGSFALPMAAFGAEVAAVEAQPDMARAITKTVAINCWKDRFTMHNGYISMKESDRNLKLPSIMNSEKGGRPYLIHPGSKYLTEKENCCPWANETVKVVPIQDLVRGRKVDFLKIDIDSFDVGLVDVVEKMITKGETSVETITCEWNSPKLGTQALHRLQTIHNYDVYCLNIHTDKRFISAKGYDVYSHFENITSNDYIEERFMQRFMRYIRYLKPQKSAAALEKARKMSGCLNLVITKDKKVMEPRFEYPYFRNGKIIRAGPRYGFHNNEEGTA